VRHMAIRLVVVAAALSACAGIVTSDAGSSLAGRTAAETGPPPCSCLWSQDFNSNGSFESTAAMGVSPDGSRVYVTGVSLKDNYEVSETVASDAATGATVWIARYDGYRSQGFAGARALAVGPGGARIFVTGTDVGPSGTTDFVTIAYDAVTGVQLWLDRFNGPGNADDMPQAIAVSPDGTRVFVTGSSRGPSTGNDYATVGYDTVTGRQSWVRRNFYPGNGSDEPAGLTVSPDSSTVFITGSSESPPSYSSDYLTVALAANTGSVRWLQRFNWTSGGTDRASAIAVSPDGSRVFVTGYSNGINTSSDYATIAYAASTGDKIWLRRYNATGDEIGLALAASPDGSRVFVTGMSPTVNRTRGTDYAYATVAYGAADGTPLWVQRYNGPGSAGYSWDDRPYAVGVSPDSSKVFVTGYTSRDATNVDFATLAYAADSGARLWLRTFSSPTSTRDESVALAVGPGGSRIFVAGTATGFSGAPGKSDYATVAYSTAP
jgi:hypothetical protein